MARLKVFAHRVIVAAVLATALGGAYSCGDAALALGRWFSG